jgi:hypothetical protein
MLKGQEAVMTWNYPPQSEVPQKKAESEKDRNEKAAMKWRVSVAAKAGALFSGMLVVWGIA